MAAFQLQQPDADIWRARFARETDQQLKFARGGGFNVLPITAPIEGYIITKGKQVLAMCTLMMDAAELAAALRYFREQGRPTHEQAAHQ